MTGPDGIFFVRPIVLHAKVSTSNSIACKNIYRGYYQSLESFVTDPNFAKDMKKCKY